MSQKKLDTNLHPVEFKKRGREVGFLLFPGNGKKDSKEGQVEFVAINLYHFMPQVWLVTEYVQNLFMAYQKLYVYDVIDIWLIIKIKILKLFDN